MKKFHPIRIAVTIGLIVIMMIQPVVIAAVEPSGGTHPEFSHAKLADGNSAESDASDASPSKCLGCSCCEVQSAEKRCCCCSSSKGFSNDDPTNNDLSSVPDAPAKDDQAGDVSSTLPSLGMCLCGVIVPPLHTNQNNIERLIVRPIASFAKPHDLIQLPRTPSAPIASRNEAASPLRDSQRFHCIWII